MLVPLVVFFGFIALAIGALLLTNKIASKYLNGDYIKLTEENGDDDVIEIDYSADRKCAHVGRQTECKREEECKKEDEVSEERKKSITFVDVVVVVETGKDEVIETNIPDACQALKSDEQHKTGVSEGKLIELNHNAESLVEVVNVISQEAGASETKDEATVKVSRSKDTSVSFDLISSESTTKVTLTAKFNTSTRIISGVIESLEGTLEGSPDDVHFHVKITPHPNKQRTKTTWTALEPHTTRNTLKLDFSIGPISVDKLQVDSRLCFRLYGKKRSCVSKSKCFGECFVVVNSIVESHGPVTVEQVMLPKTSNKTAFVLNESSHLMSSDSEAEESRF